MVSPERAKCMIYIYITWPFPPFFSGRGYNNLPGFFSFFFQGGVTFFSDNMNSYHDDDPLLSSMPVLPQEPVISRWMAEEMKKFRTICTPKVILFTKVLYVSECLECVCVTVLCMHVYVCVCVCVFVCVLSLIHI